MRAPHGNFGAAGPMILKRGLWLRQWSPAQASRPLRIASASIPRSYLAGVVTLVTDNDPPRKIGLVGQGTISTRAMIELVIGDVVIRADADIGEAHLQRVIRAVRSA